MRTVRATGVLCATLALAWWLSARWWRRASDPTQVRVPATPWPPVPTRPGERSTTGLA